MWITVKQSKKDRQRQEGEVRELEKSLQETRLLIAQAYAGFNAAADGELVESYVYEIQALQARYSYLLRQRKAYDVSAGGERPVFQCKPVRAEAAELASAQKAIVSEQPRTEEGPVLPVLPVA